MLTYLFTNTEHVPLYEQLYNCIKTDILSGKLQSNYKLPSKRAFAKNLNLSTITIENAYSQLVAEGYIYSVERKGYFVSEISAGNLHELTKGSNSLPSINKESNDYISSAPSDTSDIYDINFRNNNINHEIFPFTTWTRLMRETLLDNREIIMKSPPIGGVVELRKVIATHLRDFRNMNVSYEQIIIGAGTEYLYSLLIQLLGRDLTYGVEDPGYKKIGQIYESNDVTCKYIPLEADGISVEKLNQSKVDVIHISPSHHFPTGIVTSIKKRNDLLNWSSNKGFKDRYIIEDDYDSEFRFLGKPIPSLLSIDTTERVIYMNSFTKTLSSTIRISYMILPKELLNKFYATLSFYSCTVSTFEQYTLAHFINEKYFEKHINRTRNYYRNLRNHMIDSIKSSSLSAKSEILEEDSGLHFLLKFESNLDDETIKNKAKNKGIKVSLLSDFYHDPASSQEHVLVINYSGIKDEDIDDAISRLAECLE